MSAAPVSEEDEFVAAAARVSGWSEDFARSVYQCAKRPPTAQDERAVVDVLEDIATKSGDGVKLFPVQRGTVLRQAFDAAVAIVIGPSPRMHNAVEVLCGWADEPSEASRRDVHYDGMRGDWYLASEEDAKAMRELFMAHAPGYSLRDEPKSAPWWTPPGTEEWTTPPVVSR